MLKRVRPSAGRLALGCAVSVFALCGFAMSAPAASAKSPTVVDASVKTPWPGGTWQPEPATYQVSQVANVPVTMDDGVRLDATIDYPADPATGHRAAGKFPVLLQFTPYTDEPDSYFVQRGYIAVNVRQRGTGSSGGVLDLYDGPRSRQDGVELVNWVAHLAGSNGTIGMYGCSYPGFEALDVSAAVGPHSPLKASVDACTATGNSFVNEIFLRGGIPTATAGDFASIGALYGNNTNTDAELTAGKANMFSGGDLAYERSFWQARGSVSDAQSVVRNRIPTLLWSGWSDILDGDALNTYSAFQNAAAGRADVSAPMTRNQKVSGRYQIIVGNGAHGQGLDDALYLEWFDTFLKHENTGIDRTQTPMHLYEEGSSRWVNLSRYPVVTNYSTFYLGSNGSLAQNPQTGASGSRSLIWEQPDQPGGSITYTSTPIADGATISGPIGATIWASSSNTNMELIASVYDVSPDGTAQLISDGPILASQRQLDPTASWYDDSGASIQPVLSQTGDQYLTPHHAYELDISITARQWSVAPGHSVRFTITTQTPTSECGTAFNAEPCYYTTPQQRTLPGGTYTLLSDAAHPSALNLPLLPYDYFPTARSAVTATSAGFSEPMDWGPEGR